MALSWRPWALGIGVACGGIALARLPPRETPTLNRPPREWTTPERERVRRIRFSLEAARSALGLSTHRDRLLAAVSNAAPLDPGGPVLVIESPFPIATRRVIEEQLRAFWKELQPITDIQLGVVVAGRGLPTHVLPSAADGRRCIARLPIERDFRGISSNPQPPRPEQISAWLRREIGPCAFYAAFGRPGPAVERWLYARRFDLVRDWVASTHRYDAPLGAKDRPLLAQMARLDDRYDGSLDGVACNLGDLPRCRAALFQYDSTFLHRLERHSPPGILTRWWGESRSTLPGGSRFFADLLRAMGNERFGAFWTSTLPLDSAFSGAMGGSIEDWTMRWQRDRLGRLSARGRIRPLSVLLGLILVGLLLAASAHVAGRRQVA